jgi:hypothetical protein
MPNPTAPTARGFCCHCRDFVSKRWATAYLPNGKTGSCSSPRGRRGARGHYPPCCRRSLEAAPPPNPIEERAD